MPVSPFEFAGYFTAVVRLSTGQAVPNVSVTIKDEAAVVAVLWSDKSRVTTIANPVISDATGRIKFYTEPGTYTVTTPNGTPVTVVVEPYPDDVDQDLSEHIAAHPLPTILPIAIVSGGTGATTAGAARTNLDVPSNAQMTAADTAAINTAEAFATAADVVVTTTTEAFATAGDVTTLASAAADTDTDVAEALVTANAYADTGDALALHKAGTETVTGVKTFNADAYFKSGDPWIDVKAYGAIGDGTTHPLSGFYGSLAAAQVVYPHATALSNEIDWAAIQGAINALPTSSGTGGEVFMPRGNYLLDQSLTLTTESVGLRGAGMFSTILKYSPASGTAIKSSNNAVSKGDIHLRDFKLIATTVNTATIGLDINGFYNSRFESLFITQFGTQLSGDYGQGGATYYNMISTCIFTAAAVGTGLKGIVLSGSSANATTIDTCRFGRLATQLLVQASGLNAFIPNQLLINNCAFELADTVSIDITKGTGIWINGGRFESNALAIRLAAFPNVYGIKIHGDFTANTTNIDDQGALNVEISPGSAGVLGGYSAGLFSHYDPNRLANANFESWSSASNVYGWTGMSSSNFAASGVIAQEATIKKSGAYAVKFGNGTNTFRGVVSPVVAINNPLLQHTLTFWYTTADTTNVGIRFGFRLFDSSMTVITTPATISTRTGFGELFDVLVGSSTLTYGAGTNSHALGGDIHPTASNVMERYSAILRFPSTVAFAQVYVCTGGTVSGSSVYGYLDDIYFAEGTAPHTSYAKPITDSGDQTMYGALALSGNLTAPNVAGIKYKSGAGVTTITDGDFAATPADGTTAVIYNTTDGVTRMCARSNGVWTYVQSS